MRKLTALLAALMVLSSLSACSGDPTPTGGDQSPTGGGTLTNADRYPLSSTRTYNVWINCSADNPNSKYYITLWEEATGVDIYAAHMTGTDLALSLASENCPDAIWGSFGLEKNAVHEYGKQGKFVNFSDYMDLMPNFSKLVAENPNILLTCQNEDGSIYSLPAVANNPVSSSQLLYLRTDMLHAAGWDEAPTTTDEFLQCIQDIQAYYGANDPDFMAFHIGSGEYLNWNDMLTTAYFFPAFGELNETGLTNDADGKVVLGAGTEQYKRFIEFMIQVYNSGAFPKDIYITDISSHKALWTNGHVAITSAANGIYITSDSFASGNIELTVMKPLISEYTSTRRWVMPPIGKWQLNCINANLSEEDIRILVQWFDALYAPADDPLDDEGTISSISLNRGKLGTDYIFSEDGTVINILPHEGYSSTEWIKNEMYSQSYLLHTYVEDPSTPLGIKGKGTKENLWPYAVDASLVRYANLAQDEIAIVNSHWPDIDKYIAQMTIKWITGEEDLVSTWTTYLAKLEQLGLQDVLDAYQAAFDRIP